MTWRRIALALALAFAAVVLYAWQVEPRWIAVRTFELPGRLREALAGRRVVYLSDIHVTRHYRKAARLRALLTELKPDYLLIGGDLVWYEGDMEAVVDLLRDLPPVRLGTFSVLGDAEYMGRIRNCALCHVPGSRALRHDLPVRFLRNETVALPDSEVRLVGLDAEETELWGSTLAQAASAAPTIVLAHFPRVVDAVARTGADLVLSGDTHGGQVMSPDFVLNLFEGRNVARFRSGWFDVQGVRLLVTTGFGESLLPIRLGERPEIVVLEGGS